MEKFPEEQPGEKKSFTKEAYEALVRYAEILTRRGLTVEGEHYDRMGKYQLADDRVVRVGYIPDEDAPADSEGDRVVANIVIETIKGDMKYITEVIAAKSGNITVSRRGRDLAADQEEMQRFIDASLARNEAAMEKLKKERLEKRKKWDDAMLFEEALGINIPTETEIQEINTILQTLIEEQKS